MQVGHPQEHLALTRKVARALGADLNAALQNGTLAAQDFSTLITRCRSCASVDECKGWIAAQKRLATSAPVKCPNARVLEALAHF